MSAHLSETRIIPIGQNSRISDLFEQLIAEVENKRPGYELLSASLLMHLVSLIARKKEGLGVLPSDQPDRRLLDAMKHIHATIQKK